jgi:DNA-binding SARP family transcriptional activator
MRQNTLRVRLLGTVDLQLDNQPLPPLDSARAESLLAYLLLHRDAPQSRQHLAFLLWPRSSEAQAQTNLRKVLLNLRRGLPDADRLIEIGPRTLRSGPVAERLSRLVRPDLTELARLLPELAGQVAPPEPLPEA